ncbi:hypothetical protein SAMN05421823_10948 [Catalinimonas alkaloidigena]|uniref:Uncharacterized protein n=2 Tax=Catalinimonas alkaloidigena TaxID=1075417 RepID=A0A1G9P2M4_9BACT|nr:hypothetical protein SAMN05421823_10948 [Catalinimonas alkaloidigena]
MAKKKKKDLFNEGDLVVHKAPASPTMTVREIDLPWITCTYYVAATGEFKKHTFHVDELSSLTAEAQEVTSEQETTPAPKPIYDL